MDALLFQFYAKNDGLRLTDLHQGIVWGTNTPQTVRDERLVNRFDYDSDYGTVLNRCVDWMVVVFVVRWYGHFVFRRGVDPSTSPPHVCMSGVITLLCITTGTVL